jgi:ribonuclease BN (tRNA processing enzyme)
LTHFYPECHGIDLAAQARTAYDGQITLASDLLAIEL